MTRGDRRDYLEFRFAERQRSRRATLKKSTLEHCRVCGRVYAAGDSIGGRYRACSQTCREELRQRAAAAAKPLRL